MRNTSAKNLVDIQSGLKFAKSPRWFGQKLTFLDVHDKCIKTVDMQGTVSTVRALPYLPGSFEVLKDGQLIVGDAWRRRLYRCDTASSENLADLSKIARFCLSESVVDSCGGMYVGDAGFDFLDPLIDPVPNGVIVYISATGKSSVVATNLFFPNGMTITPDNSALIVAETLGHRLSAFEIDKDGSLRNRRVWVQFDNQVRPDGICLDRDGAIWVAGAGRCAMLVREGGEVVHKITTIRPVFATMLGGPELRHLFLCTSDSNDPVITRQVPGATIDVAEVKTPGTGRYCGTWRNGGARKPLCCPGLIS